MKRTILVVLTAVLMIVPPCFAQELEPEGIFSLHGTVWQAEQMLVLLPVPTIQPLDYEIGFYQGRVHHYLSSVSRGFYVDMFGVSIFIIASDWQFVYSFGITFPSGIGLMTEFGFTHFIIPVFVLTQLRKTDDDWIPEVTIDRIGPVLGERGTTFTQENQTGVEILARNTTFKSNPPVEVIFDPPDGLTVSSINVWDNQRIYFDLEIAIDSPVGRKRVIVTYDKGKKSVENRDVVFTVIPRGEILSISPSHGEQGTTLTSVTIMTKDTYFEDFGVSAILLMPPGGFTVSNINVISNTEIKFDLAIAVDAPVGSKIVIVTYADGITFIYNSEVVFEILEKTN